jgi:insertion element IS1 protein InsB
LQAVNQKPLSQFPLGQLERVEVVLEQVETDEQTVIEQSQLDQMWSYVGKKTNQRCLWHTIELKTGRILTYVFGQRKDEVFLKLKKLLKPFGIKKYCTDGWGTYERHLPVDKHEISKRKTQKIERHLGLRRTIKRLARKTICFSKSEEMHDLVIGLLINRYEFGLLI